MPVSDGYPVVLTADRSLMAGYRLLFDGMLAASQTTTSPLPLLSGLLMPRPARDGLRAPVAPLGLRRIEAALLMSGLSPNEVVVVDDRGLREAIGPATRVVAISAGEVLGQGMNSTTMTAVVGGRSYPEVLFRRVLQDVRRQIAARGAPAKILVGGPGAWQAAGDATARQALGIDHLVTGYAESNVAEIVRALRNGDALPAVIPGQGANVADIPAIRGASTMGVVEISRGCGLGCDFCTIAGTPMMHLPVETILADVRTNVAAGMTSVALLSEDFFRYGGQGTRANPVALLDLLARVRRVDGLRLLQIDHVNVQSIARYTDAQLAEVRALLVGDTHHDYLWVNVGVETPSGALLRANGGGGKMGGIAPAEWGAHCAEQVRRLVRAGFFPLISVMFGLPGEDDADVESLFDWVRNVQHERLAVFPVLYAPIDGGKSGETRPLSRRHWQLMTMCYRMNFRWIPRMYWDNQTGAGVPLGRRALLQTLGHGQVVMWKTLLAWHTLRAVR